MQPPPTQSEIIVTVQYAATTNTIWNNSHGPVCNHHQHNLKSMNVDFYSCVFAIKLLLFVRLAVHHKAHTSRLSPVYVHNNFEKSIPKIHTIKICPCCWIRYVRIYFILYCINPLTVEYVWDAATIPRYCSCSQYCSVPNFCTLISCCFIRQLRQITERWF